MLSSPSTSLSSTATLALGDCLDRLYRYYSIVPVNVVDPDAKDLHVLGPPGSDPLV